MLIKRYTNPSESKRINYFSLISEKSISQKIKQLITYTVIYYNLD